jgi:hypothetical protein
MNITHEETTQYGYINNIKYHISDIQQNKLDYTQIYDNHKNKLILCEGDIRKPYLRKYIEEKDTKMTDWHTEWQNNFKEYTEITYKKISDEQKKNRRCDVDLNDCTIIEFQHSCISKNEVNDRLNDWELNNKQIIWVIDGEDSIEITPVNLERQFLEFTSKLWKFESFCNYDIIYIDINDNIYKINPNIVKSRMIEVDKPISKLEFINAVKNNLNPFPINTPVYQTNIYVKQQGAGNGKTFGIIQLLQDNNYEHYDTFIYVTKQHSAKHIIHEELIDQQQRGLLQNILINKDDIILKKHIINYSNLNTNKVGKIVISTLDSLMYSMGNKNIKGIDKFKQMVLSIINEEIKCTDGGYITYGDGIYLNKKMILIGDEMQDLYENYMKALIKISRETYIDLYIVGDKLQSISFGNNAFTFLENDLQEDIINITRYEPENICRRFIQEDSINFINDIIPFTDYNLKKIEPWTTKTTEPSLEFISGKTIYANETNDNILSNEVEKIMEKYIYEVENFNRFPHDFLIVTPFVSKNPLVTYLNDAIRDYWETKYNTKEYNKYSIFHKSEVGSSIDLTESNKSTRIVSIHSSKGDGRPVVFVIGITDYALRVYSSESNNLIYNSLLHVSFTRMKEKLYIRYEEDNNDNIHNILKKYIDTNEEVSKPSLIITKKINLSKLVTYDIDNNYDNCNDNIIKFKSLPDLYEDKKEKTLIDMEHHNIRYGSIFIITCLNILKYSSNEQTEKQPIYQILNKILNIWEIKTFNTLKQYYRHLSLKKDDFKNAQIIPILNYTEKFGEYEKYYKILINNIKKIKKKILLDDLQNFDINKLTYLQIIILYYLVEIYEQQIYTNISITSLYDIIDIRQKKNKDEKYQYKFQHYTQIKNITTIFENLNYKYTNLKYLINHYIPYDGNNNNFMSYNIYTLIGYNKTHVVICNIKPQFNSLNYSETLYQSIFDSYFLKNLNNKTKNYNRFNNKHIVSCIFTFDNNNEPYYIDWNILNIDIINNNINFLTDIIRKNIKFSMKKYNNNIFRYYNYYINLYKHKKPDEIITIIIDNLKKIKTFTFFPDFITTLFTNIENEIENSDTIEYMELILYKYTDNILFITKINKLIEKYVNQYI